MLSLPLKERAEGQSGERFDATISSKGPRLPRVRRLTDRRSTKDVYIVEYTIRLSVDPQTQNLGADGG
jgi:hypothetical protein